MKDFDPSAEHYALETIAVRAGQKRSEQREHNDPIHLSSSYVFGSAQEAAEGFSSDDYLNIYSRFSNPTVSAFEQRLAQMDGGQYAVATSSGMAAVMMLSLSLLKPGDHVIASTGLFGSITGWFNNYVKPLGIEISYCEPDDLAQWSSALRANTRLLFAETPTNPRMMLSDIGGLADLIKGHPAVLAIDNCFATSALQQPLALGADIVMHSSTKFIDGQGRCVGGALVTNNKSMLDKFYGFLRTAGPTMSAFNAWVFLNGLETLSLRVKHSSQTALRLAQWLEEHPAIEEVRYPGLASHPQHQLASAQMQGGFGALICFKVKGKKAQAWQVIDKVKMLSITGNFGDAKTTITHPATTTHARLNETQQAAAGITENMLRVGVGLEAFADIQADLARGLGV